MDEIIRIVELGRAARNGANRKNRQPLAEMYVKADKDLDGFYMDIIREELNIKGGHLHQRGGGFCELQL